MCRWTISPCPLQTHGRHVLSHFLAGYAEAVFRYLVFYVQAQGNFSHFLAVLYVHAEDAANLAVQSCHALLQPHFRFVHGDDAHAVFASVSIFLDVVFMLGYECLVALVVLYLVDYDVVH